VVNVWAEYRAVGWTGRPGLRLPDEGEREPGDDARRRLEAFRAAHHLQALGDEPLDLGAREPADLLLQVAIEPPAPVVLLDGEADAHLHRAAR